MRIPIPGSLPAWGKFAGEVAIIVLGVLIALAADQMVDDARRRTAAEEARRAIRGELEVNLARLESRASLRPCLERRIAEVERLIDRVGAGDSLAPPRWIGRPQYWTMLTARWDAFTQAGQTALLPPKELADYAQMYSWMESITAEMQAEQTDWAKLRTLERLTRITPQIAFELTGSLSDARYRRWRIDLHSRQMAAPARQLGLNRIRNSLPAPRGICVAMDTPREQAIREGGSAYGEP